jgi:hypothetical protein
MRHFGSQSIQPYVGVRVNGGDFDIISFISAYNKINGLANHWFVLSLTSITPIKKNSNNHKKKKLENEQLFQQNKSNTHTILSPASVVTGVPSLCV